MQLLANGGGHLFIYCCVEAGGDGNGYRMVGAGRVQARAMGNVRCAMCDVRMAGGQKGTEVFAH